MLCFTYLICSEVAIDLGINVSPRCQTQEILGHVIGLNIAREITSAERAAAAFYLQSVQFLDGPLHFVPLNFPKEVNPTICLPCFRRKRAAAILDQCSVENGRTYAAGELSVGVLRTGGAFGTVTLGFNMTDGRQATPLGEGDVTRSGQSCANFFVSRNAQKNAPKVSLTYFEYADQSHCQFLYNEAQRNMNGKNRGDPVWQQTRSKTYTQVISCAVSSLNSSYLQMGLRAYRTMQLENTAIPAKFNADLSRFQSISTDDVYRSALAAMLMGDSKTEGRYQVYVPCAAYNWWYALPSIFGFFLFATLAVVALIFERIYGRHGLSKGLPNVPRSARGWFAQVESDAIRRDVSPRIDGAFKTSLHSWFCLQDEIVVIVDSEDGMPRMKTISTVCGRSRKASLDRYSSGEPRNGHEDDPYPV